MTGEQTAQKAGDSARDAEKTGNTGILTGSSNDFVEKKDVDQKVDPPTTQPTKMETIAKLETSAKKGQKSGAKIYAEKCSSCHGIDGKGGKMKQWSLSHGPSINKLGTIEAVGIVIREGRPKRGMPAWKNVLSEDELIAVTKYVYDFRSLKTP